jgi:tetratricopeptide (TPR) repeat protein
MKWVYMQGIPIEAQYLYRKAWELLKREHYETALRYFKQTVVLAPRYSKAYYEMANCLAYLGRYDEAITVYNRAIAIDPALAEVRIQCDMVTDTREQNSNRTELSTV